MPSLYHSSIIKFKVTLPPSLALPLSKPLEHAVDRQVVTGLGKSAAHITLSHRNAARTLLMEEFGIHRDVADSILPKDDEVFQYYTLLQHVQGYISDNRLDFLDEQEFAKAMHLHPESDTLQQLLGFFSLCPAVTPASWFLDKVKSRFTRVHGVLPDDWANGVVFMTKVVPTDEDIRLNPIPAKYWYVLRFISSFVILFRLFLLITINLGIHNNMQANGRSSLLWDMTGIKTLGPLCSMLTL